MFVSTLRLSAAEVFPTSFGSHHSAPFTHSDLDNSLRRKGRLRGLPLTSSSSAPAQRIQSDDLPLA